MLGFALDLWPLWRSEGAGATLSGAATLAAGEDEALALDFLDDHFLSTTSFYGSAYIKDLGTPANDYDSSPVTTSASLLTYTSPSAKMIRHADGLLKFAAHNLYLNSASPANQSITVVSGATYAVTITGSVSVTASGAATGTWTAGTNTFTAATTTLTLGSTSGAGTVHVYRTPADSTYPATGASARYALPIEFDASGNPLGLLVEEERTNRCLWSSDLTNAAWVKTTSAAIALVAAAKTATGPDGVANSASTLTASVANGYVRQVITSASAARMTSCFIKRRAGTGSVYLSQSEPTGSELVTNGTFDTDTSGWTASNATLTAPSGALIVTSTTSSGTAIGYQSLSGLTPGALYILTATATRLDANSGSARVAIYENPPSNILNQTATTSTGATTTGTIIFAAPADGEVSVTCILVGVTAIGAQGSFDNITVRRVAETEVTVTNNWTRVQVSSATITNPQIALRLATSGDEVDVALFQHEVGAFVTSPIPTYGAQATRVVDNISIATSRFPYSTSVGTVFIGFRFATATAPAGTDQKLWEVLNGTSNVFSTDRYDGSTKLALRGLNINVDTTRSVGNSPAKWGVVFAAGDVAASLNGGTVYTNASASGSLTATSLNIGRSMTGNIRELLYLPRRVSNADMQTLTTP